jgi:putative addiction module component (TIGR02574 family)
MRREEAAMPVDLESLGIDRLSVQDRLNLIEQIWNSLPETLEPHEVPDWHLVELARRRADAITRPGEGRPWREALGSPEIPS